MSEAKRADANELAPALQALAIVLGTGVNDVLDAQAKLKTRVAKLEEDLEVWSGGAVAPVVGRHYGIMSHVLGEAGFHGAFWHGQLDVPEIEPADFAAYGFVATETHVPSRHLAFRYLGCEPTEHIEQASRWQEASYFFDREHRFAAPYLGDTMSGDFDAKECPSRYTEEEGLAIVGIRERFLHDVFALDDGEDEVRLTGTRGRYGGIPRWLAWRRR